MSRLGQSCNITWVNKLQPWVDRWDHADEDVVQPTGPHMNSQFYAYLAWYQPRTRSRITFVDTHPQPHLASSQDGYAYHRDEALAGAVSYKFWQRLYFHIKYCGN